MSRGRIRPERGLALQSATVIPGWNPSQGQNSRGKDHGHLPAWKKQQRVPPSCREMPNPGQIQGAAALIPQLRSTSVTVPEALGGHWGEAMASTETQVCGRRGEGDFGAVISCGPCSSEHFSSTASSEPGTARRYRGHPEHPVPVPTQAPSPVPSRAELLFPPDPPQVLKIAAGALTHTSHPPSEPVAPPGASSAVSPSVPPLAGHSGLAAAPSSFPA